ncbi:MAG: thiol reductant ABC exporter subunit CydD, partial [Clostridiales bacterium]|nr:thiol reductant ABC exporter subunit CydD [Clostridiales bacterium]
MIKKNLMRESMRDRLHLAGTVLFGLLGGIAAGVQAYLLAFIVAAAFRGGLNLRELRSQLILFFAIIVLRGTFGWLEERFALSLGKKVQQELRRNLMEKISKLGPVRLREHKYGALLTLLTEGLDSLEIYFQKYLPQLFKSAVLPVTFLIIVFPLDWQTGLIMCLTAPLVPVFMSLIGQWTKGQTLRQWQVLSRMGGYFQDVFEGLATLKLFNRTAGQREKIEEVSEDFRAGSLQVLKWGFLSSFVLEILTTISIAMIAVGLGLRLVYGMLDFRIALFILFLAPEFYLPLRSLGAQYHNSLNGAAAAKSIYSLLAQTDPDPNSEPKTQNSKPGQANSSENIALVFDNVCFSYEAERTALNNVSFSLKAGEKLGLIGPSGSGKTTLLNLLAGFIQPGAGSISLQGQLLGSQDPDTLRRQLAFVPQNPYLFKGTIMDNIRLGNPAAGEEEVISVCRELGVHDQFSALPQGYNTRLGQGGCDLSGGERQMLAIARACLKNAPLIMLDEATRNLDWQNDYLLQKALDRLTRGKTVIAITHRLQTIAKMDKLLVLADGRVAQFGPPNELMRPSAARIQNSVFRIQNAGSIRFAKTIKQKPCFSLKPLRRKLLMDQPGALSSLLRDRVTSTPPPAKPALPPFKGGAREYHLVTCEHEAAM